MWRISQQSFYCCNNIAKKPLNLLSPTAVSTASGTAPITALTVADEDDNQSDRSIIKQSLHRAGGKKSRRMRTESDECSRSRAVQQQIFEERAEADRSCTNTASTKTFDRAPSPTSATVCSHSAVRSIAASHAPAVRPAQSLVVRKESVSASISLASKCQ